jgi:hypothetical protein
MTLDPPGAERVEEESDVMIDPALTSPAIGATDDPRPCASWWLRRHDECER